MEGSPILSTLSKRLFQQFDHAKIQMVVGDITETFVSTLLKYQPQFIFLDADHRGSSLLRQVDQILNVCHEVECIVVHDVHWSKDMNSAWKKLIKDERFNLTIDIFQAGLIFPSKHIEKQHFTLRF